MKITQIPTQPLEIPFDKPLGTSIHRITSVAALLVWIDTDEGITGESYLWVIGKHKLPVLMEMVRSLEPVVKHRNPLDVAARFDEMWNEINFLGHKGVTIFGIAAIDWACWDIKGKALGVSLGDLLGRKRDKIPAYASGGLWTSMSITELQAEAKSFLSQGFKAMKMRVGLPDIGEDVERVAAVRETIGNDIILMVDANQGLNVTKAIRLGRQLEKYNLAWFEEPVQAYDLAGSAVVVGLLLFIFTTFQGIGASLLGANAEINSSGFSIDKLLPEISNSDHSSIVYHIMNLMDNHALWLTGLLAVGLIAALQSTAASLLMTSGSIITRDFYKALLNAL